MVRLLISAVLLAAAVSVPIENVADMLEAPHAGRHMAVGKIRRTSPTGTTAPGEIIRGGAEEDGEETSVPGELRGIAASVASRRIASEGLLPSLDVRVARSVLASGPSSARAPPLAS